MKKNTILALVLLAAVAMTASANGGSDAAQQIKIGLSPLALSNPFFVEFVNGAREEAEKQGVTLVVADNGGEVNKQVSDIENFIAAGFQGFIVTAVDPNAVSTLAKEALDQGMYVVAHTADLGKDNQTALVWAEERDMGLTLGREAGSWAEKNLPAGKTLKIAVLHYDVIPQVIKRREGIIEGIEETFSGDYEIVGTALTGGPQEGLTAGETWLQAYPDLDMIVSVNDGGALGAYQAVIAAGRNDASGFFVGGIDATQEAVAAIGDGGAFQATVDQQPKAMGSLCVQQIIKAVNGEPVEDVIGIKLAAVNRSNWEQFQ